MDHTDGPEAESEETTNGFPIWWLHQPDAGLYVLKVKPAVDDTLYVLADAHSEGNHHYGGADIEAKVKKDKTAAFAIEFADSADSAGCSVRIRRLK